MIFVIPQFQKIFADMLNGAAMPALTQMIINISDFMRVNYIATIGIVVGVVVALKLFFKTKIGIKFWDTMALKAPKIGDMVMKSTVARFTRTFGTLLASGVPILEALNITRGTLGNSLISDALGRVHDRVRDGEPLDQQHIFPSMVTSMVEVGEETGQLSEMLTRIADNYDEEVDNSVGAITSIIEPIMIVFLAVVVGTIVIALFLPIIQIITKLTGG